MEAPEKQQTATRRHRFTADEFHMMGEAGIFTEDDRVEPPIGWRHASCVNALTSKLVQASQDSYRVSIQNPVRLDEHNEAQPDIALLGDEPVGRLPGPDSVLILKEVSGTTLVYDTNVKLPLYAATGVPETWIVDLSTDRIETYPSPKDDEYRNTTRYKKAERLQSPTIPEPRLDTGEIFPSRDPEQ